MTNYNFEKKRPKKMIYDKEELYDSTIQLKQKTNSLLEENHKFKAKLQQMLEDAYRKNKVISDLMAQLSNLSNAPSNIGKIQQEVIFFI